MKDLTALQIGRFRIEKGIGQGGMGIVYRAHDTVLERPVALKLLGEHLRGSEQAFARFRREAETLMRLKHSNIALVYDFGEHEGRPYIAMEWVEGRTLKALLQEEGKLSLARSLHIVAQLASALDYAHAHGVVHRDIKPANILIDANDHATIVDFGVAWWDEAPSLTTTGTIVGTPLYMSPEQLLGQPLDGRSDLYSLGIIFYEMLAGKPPFGGEAANTPAVIQQQLYLPPPPLMEQAPSTPAWVSASIEKMLSKLPEERFKSGEDFVRALNQGEGAATRPASRIRSILKKVLLGVAALLLVGFVVILWPRPDSEPEPTPVPAPTQAFTPTPQPEREETWVPMNAPDSGEWPGIHGDSRQSRYQEQAFYPLAADARWRYQSEETMEQPMVAANEYIFVPEGERVQVLNWQDGSPANAAPRLGAAIVAPLALQNEEGFRLYAATEDQQFYALDGYDLSLLWRLGGENSREAVVQQTVGPDEHLYAGLADGSLLSISQEGEIQFSLMPVENSPLIQPPTATATGIYVINNQHVMVAIDPQSQQVVWQSPWPALPTTPALPLESYGVVAAGDEEAQVRAVSVLSGELRWQQQLNDSVTGLAYDYDYLFVTTGSGTLYCLEPYDGTILWQQHVSESPLFAPVVTTNGVLVVSQQGQLQVFNKETGDPQPGAALELGVDPTQAPVFIGGWLFVQDEASIWAFGPNGEPAP